ncbi:MAG: diguanylate cyclase domain-containing protein [Desulfovibrio sp.]|uniref:diguanylate cyclase domain-containing protein n=1 Tax=Desulfovibrio sp. 7SRBS1 TaxID=3378064 RepID=UPI003B3EBD85
MDQEHLQNIPPYGKAKALVVADEAVDRGLITPVLAEYGFVPCVFSEAAQALAALREDTYTLAVIDVDAQNSNGFGLAREIKQRSPQTGIIFITGRGVFEDAVEAIRIGAYDYLSRPFSRHEMAMAVRRYRERLRLEDLAFQAQLQYDHLVQNIPIIIFSLNTVSFRLEFINRASYAVLGYRPDEAIDEPGWLLRVVHPEDRDMVTCALRESPVCDEGFSFQCRMRHKKGHTVYAIIRSMPCTPGLASREGELVDGVILDVTERVMLEQTLVQDEKLKTLGAISAEMAHEIRNPLMSIGGFARRLRDQSHESMEADIILRETRRLEALLDRINEYMRPLRVFRQACLCQRVLAECANLLYPEMQAAQVRVELALDGDLPTIFADPDILGQVFLHIMTYGVGVMPPDTTMEITASGMLDMVEVGFRYPLKEAVQLDPDRIFLPFEEGGYAGLPLSHRLVKSMGGTLTCTQGRRNANFVLTLPRETGPAENVMRELDGMTPDLVPGSGARGDYSFEGRLEREWHRAVRDGRLMAALIIDVDRFEAYLGKYGRRQAHDMLESVTGALGSILTRPGDFFASFGSQQYTVILPDTDEAGAVYMAEDIRKGIAELDIPHARSDVAPHVTVSVGAAFMAPCNGENAVELLSEASKALFIAKQLGRDRVYAAGPS